METQKENKTVMFYSACPKSYLEGQGDLVSGLIMGIIRVTILWVIGVIKPLT